MMLRRGNHLDGRKAARAAIAEAHAAGGKICAFFCESVLSCGGQVSALARLHTYLSFNHSWWWISQFE